MKLDVMEFQLQLFGESSGYSVEPIKASDTHYLLLNVHYAKRIPSIIHSFGLFKDGELVGVITYGKPASRTLCIGICGHDWAPKVLELNRLCLVHNDKHEASRLVGASLRMLPKPTVVVSYADTSQDHLGVVYQATNFIYTGLSDRHKVWVVEGMEHVHPRSLGHSGNLKELKEVYGDRLIAKERPRKHRYIFFCGNKTEVKAMRKALRYGIEPYPKRGICSNDET